jgi:hypothetical protein
MALLCQDDWNALSGSSSFLLILNGVIFGSLSLCAMLDFLPCHSFIIRSQDLSLWRVSVSSIHFNPNTEYFLANFSGKYFRHL